MSMITFACPYCQKKTSLRRELSPLGKKKICKGCGKTFTLKEKYQQAKNKKLMIECPICGKDYNIRVYRNCDKYECTLSRKVFSLNEVKNMQILDVDDTPTVENLDKTQLLDSILPIFEINAPPQEEITHEVTQQFLKEASRKQTLKELTLSIVENAQTPQHYRAVNETTMVEITKNSKAIGKYRILGEVGSGGFGQVLMAFDPSLQRYVAIKQGVKIKKREAQLLAKFNHPHIVQIHDLGQINDNYYIVMEYIQGLNIAEYAQRIKKSTSKKGWVVQMCKCFVQLADALVHLHENELYHSDIKPLNILVLPEKHHVKLIDFGTGFTYRYVAPERLDKKGPSAISDIYSYGCVLFEILCGRPVNLGKTKAEMMFHATRHKQFPPEVELDEHLKKICLQCLEINDKQRYQSMSEVKIDLLNYIAVSQNLFLYPSIRFENDVSIPLTKAKNYIGRSCANDIVIHNNQASRIHALISISQENYYIQNLSKYAKIRVGDQWLAYNEKYSLNAKTEILILKTRLFFIPCEDQASEYLIIDTQQENNTLVVTEDTSDMSENTIAFDYVDESDEALYKIHANLGNSGVYYSEYPARNWVFRCTSDSSPLKSAPVVMNNYVYFASASGYVYCIDRIRGKSAWHYFANDRFLCTPIVTDYHVYVGNSKFYKLDKSSGKLVWEFSPASEVRSSAVVCRQKILFGCEDGCFYAVDHQGELQWTFSANSQIRSPATVYKNTVIFTSYDNYLYGLDLDSGQSVFRHVFPKPIDKCPAIYNNVLYAGCDDGILYALDLETQQIIWKFATQDRIRCAPMVCSKGIFFGSTDGNLYALDFSGYLRWKYTTESPIVCSPVFDEGKIYFGGNDKHIYCINEQNGQTIFSSEENGRVTAVALCKHTLYAIIGYDELKSISLQN